MKNRHATPPLRRSLPAILGIALGLTCSTLSATPPEGTPFTASSTDTPKAIPDNGSVTSTINVTALGTITDLNVRVNISHSWISDIVITLQNLTTLNSITLASKLGTSGDNYADTLFDDSAATSITAGSPPFTGSFQPQTGTLSSFNGGLAAGDWILTVSDVDPIIVGTLNSWALEFTLFNDALAATHWKGQTGTAWSGANWSSDATGTATTALPTTTTDLVFSATGAANQLSTVLDTDFSIKSLTVNDIISISGSETLTISGGTTVTGGLTINSGITVTSQSDSLIEATGTGAAATVTGADAKWDTTGSLNVGFTGDGMTGTLNVLLGGAVTAGDLHAGAGSGSTGTVTVNGAGSTLAAGETSIGSSGMGTLNIEEGGVVTTTGSAILGEFYGSVGLAKVTGTDSKWTITGDLTIDSGGAGTLNVLDGGVVSNVNATLATSANLNAAVTVDGNGSTWTNTGDLTVGVTGPATLDVKNGGVVTSVKGVLGASGGSTGTVTVTDAGSKWTMTGDLLVDTGGTGVLNILAGGEVSNVNGVVATGSTDALIGTVTVDGSGSKWTNSGTLTVGDTGPGTLNIQNGGQVDVNGMLAMLTLGASRGSSGTLNIGAFVDGMIVTDATTSGRLNAAEVKGGDGTATVNFNQTDDINFDAKISGSTSVNQKGVGITNLTAASTYTGTTNIDMGALAVSGSLSGAGNVTVAANAMLTGGGSITTAEDHSIFINGILNVQDVGMNSRNISPAATFSLATSGTGSVVMGPGSFIVIDLFTGAGLGDNTLTRGASDMLNLTGTLNASAGGTLIINNPNAMTGFATGDRWQIVNLHAGEGTGQITGTLTVNDSSLGLSNGFVGSFDQTTGIYSLKDTRGEISAQTTGVATAEVQGQVVISTVQSAISDINGRLFNLRAGGGEVIAGSLAASLDDGVIVGQGDGPEDSPIARKVARAYQWEVYTTVNYAYINQNSISTQAGVRSTSWTPGIGIERHLTSHWAVGFAVSLMETHQTYTSGLGTLDMEGVAISAYTSYVRGAFWGDVLYNFGYLDLDSNRNPGLGLPVAFGSTSAITNTVQFNTGWNFRFQNNTLVTGPFVGIDYLHAEVDGYSETGGGIGALAYGRRGYDSVITRLGWSVSKKLDTHFAKITPQVRVAFERQNIENNNGTSVNLINQPFTATANSQAPGQEYMMAGAGVNFEFSDKFNMLLTYQGQFLRQDQSAHYAGVRFGYKF